MTERMLQERDFPGGPDAARLLPAPNRDSAPFWEALALGRLELQHCEACGRGRHPVAPVCPHCGARDFAWRAHPGSGTVHSWVRYHRAYLPEFEGLMPYVVLCVSLDGGPRMFGRLAGDASAPHVGMAVQAIVERLRSGECVAAFVPAAAG